jgi:phosphoribosylanthranilate isomerase
MIVKICGITRPEDAEAAVDAGADWIGLNFWPRSRRYIASIDRAVAIAAAVPGDVKKVGVFVNAPAPQIEEIASRVGLSLIQFHGDEDPAFCARFAGRYLRAFRVASAADLRHLDAFDCEHVLLDTPQPDYGGGGVVGDWSLARQARASGKKLLLAGGLTPDNVSAAVRDVRPFGVDVASGVESAPGVKDAALVRRFVAAAKGRSA